MKSINIGLVLAIAGTMQLPLAQAEDKPNVRVKLETSLGDIVLELDAAKAPISTENFLTYTREKFYDNTIFHRVMPTFMIQGGGYDPEINEKKEGLHPPIKNEWQNGLKNVRGSIAMARTNVPDSATAQFFINVVDNARLDAAQPDGAAYAVFGKVVEGMATVDKIKDTETAANPKYPGGKVVPVTTVVIKSVRVMGDAGSAPAKKDEAKKEEGKPASEAKKPEAEKKPEAAAKPEGEKKPEPAKKP